MHQLDCPLCHSSSTWLFLQKHRRNFWRCDVCQLTFVAPDEFLPADEEISRYLLHENDPADERYRQWLAQVSAVLLPKLAPNSCGLDFGSGPGPTLSVMMAEAGHEMAVYDPFFAPDRTVLDESYDFITCTETAEHFQNPHQEFALLNSCLRTGGWLGVMTQILDDDARFADWWYIRDDTHVAFYKQETMAWIADHFGWRMEMGGKNVVLFQKGKRDA